MKLVLFRTSANTTPRLGVLTPRGIVDASGVLGPDATGPTAMHATIDRFDAVRETLTTLAGAGAPVAEAALLAPLPRPGKILCTTARYGTDLPPTSDPLLLTLKSAESVIGPEDTVRLPAVGASWQFVPEAELGLVIRGPAKDIRAADWRRAVFGYTIAVDIMARGDQQLGRDYWLAKADTLNPLGPCIVTADEIPEPNLLEVRSTCNGQPLQSYALTEAEHSVAQLVEFATTIMTLKSGDVVACGTSPDGLQALADGDQLDVVIEPIGHLTVAIRSAARGPA